MDMLPVHRTDPMQQANLSGLCCGNDEADPPPLVELPAALLFPLKACRGEVSYECTPAQPTASTSAAQLDHCKSRGRVCIQLQRVQAIIAEHPSNLQKQGLGGESPFKPLNRALTMITSQRRVPKAQMSAGSPARPSNFFGASRMKGPGILNLAYG